jgi:hypothetical protein
MDLGSYDGARLCSQVAGQHARETVLAHLVGQVRAVVYLESALLTALLLGHHDHGSGVGRAWLGA